MVWRCTAGSLAEKYGVPKVRTRCGVDIRERDPQIDPRRVPQCLWPLRRAVPNPLHGPKWLKWSLSSFFEKSLKISVRNHVYGLVGLSKYPRKDQGQWLHVVAHERHHIAQKWARTWVPPFTHLNKEMKMKIGPLFLTWNECSSLSTFQSCQKNDAVGSWGHPWGAQMWRRILQF